MMIRYCGLDHECISIHMAYMECMLEGTRRLVDNKPCEERSANTWVLESPFSSIDLAIAKGRISITGLS